MKYADAISNVLLYANLKMQTLTSDKDKKRLLEETDNAINYLWTVSGSSELDIPHNKFDDAMYKVKLPKSRI